MKTKFKRVSKKEKQLSDEYFIAGLEYLRAKEYVEAGHHFLFALYVNCRHAAAARCLGISYYRVRDFESSVKYLRKAIEIDYVSGLDADQAQNDLERLIQRYPNEPAIAKIITERKKIYFIKLYTRNLGLPTTDKEYAEWHNEAIAAWEKQNGKAS